MKLVFTNDFDIKPDKDLDPEIWNSANGFCLDQEGKVCVVYEKEKGYWCLPGGGKEGGETPEETFVREVAEEAQAEAEQIEYFHCVYARCFDESGIEVPDPKNMICFRYICKLKNIQEFVPHKSEIDERKFVTLGELPEYITWLKDSENGVASFEILKQKIK